MLHMSKWVGRRLACALVMSPAVVFIAPVIVMAILLCMDWSFLVTETDPCFLLLHGGLCIIVYHTSAAYVNLGTTTVRYRRLIWVAEMPDVVLARRRTCVVHQVAVAITFAVWVFHVSLGSKRMLRYLWEFMGFIIWWVAVEGVGVPLGVLFSMMRGGVESFTERGKCISASLVISNGELWVCDHSSAPPGLSIMSLSRFTQSCPVFPTASNSESSTNLGESSSFDLASSISGAL